MIGRMMVLLAVAPYFGKHQKSAWRLLRSSVDTELGEQALQTLHELLKLHPNKTVLLELESEPLTDNPKLELFRSFICRSFQ